MLTSHSVEQITNFRFLPGVAVSLTVLYITGWCRSGSTVLGNVLAEVPGVVHVGELPHRVVHVSGGDGARP